MTKSDLLNRRDAPTLETDGPKQRGVDYQKLIREAIEQFLKKAA